MAKAWAELGLKVPTVSSSLDEKADRILAALDVDGGGTISVKEFEAYMLARDVWCKPEDVADIVSALDTNKDGVITREELRAGLASHGSGPPPLERLMASRPPSSGNAVFDELVRGGGPIDIPKAEERAITLGQLKRTLAHASRRCVSEGWLGKRPVDGTWKYVPLLPPMLSLYDLASHVILPATYGRTIGGTSTKPSYVEIMADGPQRPDYFVSHFW